MVKSVLDERGSLPLTDEEASRLYAEMDKSKQTIDELSKFERELAHIGETARLELHFRDPVRFRQQLHLIRGYCDRMLRVMEEMHMTERERIMVAYGEASLLRIRVREVHGRGRPKKTHPRQTWYNPDGFN